MSDSESDQEDPVPVRQKMTPVKKNSFHEMSDSDEDAKPSTSSSKKRKSSDSSMSLCSAASDEAAEHAAAALAAAESEVARLKQDNDALVQQVAALETAVREKQDMLHTCTRPPVILH